MHQSGETLRLIKAWQAPVSDMQYPDPSIDAGKLATYPREFAPTPADNSRYTDLNRGHRQISIATRNVQWAQLW